MKHHHGATSAAKKPAPKQAAPAAAKGAKARTDARADAREVRSADALAGPGSMPVVGREDRVRQTAYFFYEARGRIHGHEMEDWLRAEAEVERALAGIGPADAAAASAH